jgi:nucleoid-associated protein YgaU
VVADLTGSNDKLADELKGLQQQLSTLREENTRLAGNDQARQQAEQRAESLTAAAAQLAAAQRALAATRAEVSRLNETVQGVERDRNARLSQLQNENVAITARLRQAQGTLEQIASAARLIDGGSMPAPSAPAAASGSTIPTIPITSGAPIPARIHVVAEGDSLTRISVRYYGTSNRWQEIYDANRELLRGENTLRPGQRLRIP